MSELNWSCGPLPPPPPPPTPSPAKKKRGAGDKMSKIFYYFPPFWYFKTSTDETVGRQVRRVTMVRGMVGNGVVWGVEYWLIKVPSRVLKFIQ